MNSPAGAAVQLQQLPVDLFVAMEEQTDALLREYVMVCLGRSGQPFGLDETTRAGAAKAVVSEAVQQTLSRKGHDEATRSFDIGFELLAATAGDFAVLQAVLDHAVRLATTGELLTLPSLPEIVALRNWICDEVVGQVAGAAPTAWPGVTGTAAAPNVPRAEWDGIRELSTQDSWLVGDDHNRIIAASPPALALLGWVEADLVGQRILAVIPPALRERHVAGFTRSVITHDDRLLDTPLALTALARDNEEIPVTLLLSRHTARKGRMVYLARLDARS